MIRHPQIFQDLSASQGPRIGLPLGLLYIAASVRKAFPRIVIRIIDALVDFPLDMKRPRFDAKGFIHFGMTYEEIKQVVDDFVPELVGISTQYSDFLEQAYKTATAVREALPSVPIVMGGNPATSNPCKILKHSEVDIVVIGEGERTFTRVVGAINEGKGLDNISGLAFISQAGRIVFTKKRSYIDNLDSLPLPAYDLVDMERYFWMEKLGFTSRYKFEYPGSHRTVSVITSRGCPFRCVFCSIHIHMGRRFRSHSPDYVLNHLETLRLQYGVKHIHFEDDNLTLHRRRFSQILDGIISRNMFITWDTPNGIRVDTLNRELICKIKRSGAIYITVGIESGSQKVNRRIVKKALDLKVAVRNIRIAWEEGLDVHAFYVVGFPGETREQIKATFDLAIRLKKLYGVQPHLGIANPIENTEMYSLAQKAGWLKDSPQDSIQFHFGREKRFKRKTIHTSEFDIDYLNKEVNKFNNRITFITITKAVIFLLTHPALVVDILEYGLDCTVKKRMPILKVLKSLFLKKLFYPFFYLR